MLYYYQAERVRSEEQLQHVTAQLQQMTTELQQRDSQIQQHAADILQKDTQIRCKEGELRQATVKLQQKDIELDCIQQGWQVLFQYCITCSSATIAFYNNHYRVYEMIYVRGMLKSANYWVSSDNVRPSC